MPPPHIVRTSTGTAGSGGALRSGGASLVPQRAHLAEEISDVQLYLIRLADVCDMDLPAAVTVAVAAPSSPATVPAGPRGRSTGWGRVGRGTGGGTHGRPAR